MLFVSKVFRDAVRGHYGTNCLYNVYVDQEMEQGREPCPFPREQLRFSLLTTPIQDEDNSSEHSDDETSPGPRTVFAWGGTFAIYQSC